MINYDDKNIFAKILRGEIPCEKIYDVNPQKKNTCFSYSKRKIYKPRSLC